ncbi:MAG: branched-chain amino acid aminotransferase [Psittacicella sp.]
MVDIDWNNIGFKYRKTDFRFIAKWKDGVWSKGELTTDNQITISEASTTFHYGQQCFEGLKAYRWEDGSINLFRPEENAKRFQQTCDRIMMPTIPVEIFVDACKQVVEANKDWVPPYGSNGTLYIRPFMIGVGDNIGLSPAPEFIFSVFCLPVGSYSGGLNPSNFLVSDYDRAAPFGTGGVKVGGNYAASLLPYKIAHDNNFADCVYLDPATHTKIEEIGAANFFGITADNTFVTPKSPSILPSVTKYSLLYLAKHHLGLKAVEDDVYIDQLYRFTEAGACGTAAVIIPIGGIQYKNNLHVFYSETEVGPISKKLYDELTGIQFGKKEAPKGWITKVL